MYPARSSRRWLGAPASAGSSRSVGMNILDQRMICDSLSGRAHRTGLIEPGSSNRAHRTGLIETRSLSPAQKEILRSVERLSGQQRGQVSQAADVLVPVRLGAEAIRVQVHRLQAGRQGAGHIVAEA